jgi:DNA-binding GntR family transcriptional regulator
VLDKPRGIFDEGFDQIFDRIKDQIVMPPRIAKSSENAEGAIGHTRKAYLGIRNMMLHNDLMPGQKIAYRDLAERLGMSQTPIIQALKWLEFQQLVRHEPNRGYFTAPIDLKEVQEIYDVRETLEMSLLPGIVRTIDRQGIRTLRAALAAHLKASREIYLAERLKRDMEFHLTLAQLSGNQVHHRILKDLFDLLYLKYSGNVLFSTSMDSADADHQALFDSIADGDLKTARRILSGHIRRVREHVLKGLRQITDAKHQAGI